MLPEAEPPAFPATSRAGLLAALQEQIKEAPLPADEAASQWDLPLSGERLLWETISAENPTDKARIMSIAAILGTDELECYAS